ncbi:MAG: nuclear transport factor 2 family protein [Robiginitomaculum sp.]
MSTPALTVKLFLAAALGFGAATLGQQLRSTPVSPAPHAVEQTPSEQSDEALAAEIRTVLARQDAAWNRGDIEGFMVGYWQSDDLRFASAGNIQRGYQATLDGYLARYPSKDAMGLLSFSDLEINILSQTHALVFGHWKLTRKHDTPSGLYTLHMQKRGGEWVIMSDHTSSAD